MATKPKEMTGTGVLTTVSTPSVNSTRFRSSLSTRTKIERRATIDWR